MPLRQLFTLITTIQMDGLHAQLEIAALPKSRVKDKKGLERKVLELMAKHNALREIFWVAVKEEFGCWDGGVTVRENWMIVRPAEEEITGFANLEGLLGSILS